MNLWYVIQTKPKEESKAESYLSTKGVEIINPLMETFNARHGRMSKELKPLFPGYIFGHFDLHQDYPLVRWGRGVKCVLGFGGYPIPLSDEAIEIIKNRLGCKGHTDHAWPGVGSQGRGHVGGGHPGALEDRIDQFFQPGGSGWVV